LFIAFSAPFLGAYADAAGRRISGSGAAFGYWGGVLSLAVMLALFAESATTGTTMIGLSPVLGLDADA